MEKGETDIDPVEELYRGIKARAEEAESPEFGNPGALEAYHQDMDTAKAEIQQKMEAGEPLSDELQAWNQIISEQQDEE